MTGVDRAARRRGFALLSILWVIAAATTLALAAELAARGALGIARNRGALTLSRWKADDCVARVRTAIALVLGDAGRADVAHAGRDPWVSLDRRLAEAPELADLPCGATLTAVGSRIDVNAADADLLQRALVNAGVSDARADSLVDALLDWRDADDSARAGGAERAWYADHHRFLPRNGAIASVLELRRIRGFESVDSLDAIIDVEPGRIAVERAPIAILAALPGVGPEAAAQIADRRARDRPVGELVNLAASLSMEARSQLESHARELSSLTTSVPDGWLLTVRAAAGAPPVESIVELRIARAGRVPSVVRRREWP